MKRMKMIFGFLKSMKFGIFLLGMTGILSMAGSILPQLNDIYNSYLFIVVFSVLCMNLAFCCLGRLGILLKVGGGGLSRRYAGSLLLHGGILVMILFIAYGQMTFSSEEVSGVPGDIKEAKSAGVYAMIKDFKILYRDDGTVSQYRTEIELYDAAGRKLEYGVVSVNNPLRYKGYSFYQTGTGWAADIEVRKKDNVIKTQLCYEGASCEVPEENIAFRFFRFYPDHEISENGIYSKSNKLLNPISVYIVYYRGKPVKMEGVAVGEAISWNDYGFVIKNPRQYSLLKVNRMRGQEGALLGAISVIAGLFAVFYLKPRKSERPAMDNKNKKEDINVR